MSQHYSIEFPDYYDDYAEEIRAKGYFADLTVRLDNASIRPTIYDATRLSQEFHDAFASGSSYFSAPMIIVVPAVSRSNIIAAIEALALGNFEEILGTA